MRGEGARIPGRVVVMVMLAAAMGLAAAGCGPSDQDGAATEGSPASATPAAAVTTGAARPTVAVGSAGPAGPTALVGVRAGIDGSGGSVSVHAGSATAAHSARPSAPRPDGGGDGTASRGTGAAPGGGQAAAGAPPAPAASPLYITGPRHDANSPGENLPQRRAQAQANSPTEPLVASGSPPPPFVAPLCGPPQRCIGDPPPTRASPPARTPQQPPPTPSPSPQN
ncbi:hypothetical protein [Candidatus Frankia nodulisporulans]|uniref:hypothetical protein n=1 Tax=Candidatus Frankia nodulisporulans TaxID=2060052 RepID=UPI0013D535BF|nr:hypothetical protein [Candidatus Frankia nodulisporulans]